MRLRRSLARLVPVALVALGLPVLAAAPAVASTGTRQISAAGTTSPLSAPLASDAGLQDPEFAGGEAEADTAAAASGIVDRSLSTHPGRAPAHSNSSRPKSNPTLGTTFEGLNFRQQRLANGGNQFSVEPPDQGLCAGNGYVLESTNDVLRIFDTAGNAVTGVVDLNTFYGYPAAINRTTGARGPFVTDPSCYYDQATQRWFHVVLTLEVNPSGGAFLGQNFLDIAVSASADPTGAWTVYHLDVSDNGQNGTPDHHCAGGWCLGDYPHIGADAHGFYITTNEYPFFADGFHGAQLYALSKSALASGASSIAVTQIDTANSFGANPGFTVWPATSPGLNSFALGQGGTEYFLSSDAAEEAHVGDGSYTGTSTDLLVWALTNTSSLDSATPSLGLSTRTLTVGAYGIPPKADQKSGPAPLRECLNDSNCATNVILGAPDPYAPEPLSPLDSNDTRMQQVTYANGKLWGALDTALDVGGATKAGIAWYVVKPGFTGTSLTATVAKQGYLGVAGNNVTYPAIGVTPSGRGVMAFTLTGADHFPSAAYASLDAIGGVGAVQVAAEGVGPQDGFSGYAGLTSNPPRPRWGDYGATAVVGNTVWIATEYIAQSCTLAQYLTAPVASCGGTRAALGNWSTRVSSITP